MVEKSHVTEIEAAHWPRDSGELLVSGRYKLVRYTERSTGHVTYIPPAQAGDAHPCLPNQHTFSYLLGPIF